MARRNLSGQDISQVEQSSLDRMLAAQSASPAVPSVAVEEALKGEGVLELSSNRNVTRVLFISRDESLLTPTKQTLDGYIDVAELFDEVHILILRQGIPTKTPVVRVAQNVWIYVATHPHWWGLPGTGKRLAIEQLVFAEGFRPDLIVARDPFESALVALSLGKMYDRPVQVHVLDMYFTPGFEHRSPSNRWRRFIPRYTLMRTMSVRTDNRRILQHLQQKFSIPDCSLLPRFHNYAAIIEQPETIDLREKYKPFVFIMLYIGPLSHDANFPDALDAARLGLRNPHIGLITLGSGPAQIEFEKRAEILGVREQVVFETTITDSVPYLKSANVLIVTDTTPESDELILKAAAAGIPIIMARTPEREDLFVDGESAFLVTPHAIDELSIKLNIIMNDVPLRRRMVLAAQDIIETRFMEDEQAYRLSYRESIEKVFFLE